MTWLSITLPSHVSVIARMSMSRETTKSASDNDLFLTDRTLTQWNTRALFTVVVVFVHGTVIRLEAFEPVCDICLPDDPSQRCVESTGIWRLVPPRHLL